jgi:hypothetical protein
MNHARHDPRLRRAAGIAVADRGRIPADVIAKF